MQQKIGASPDFLLFISSYCVTIYIFFVNESAVFGFFDNCGFFGGDFSKIGIPCKNQFFDKFISKLFVRFRQNVHQACGFNYNT